MHPHKQWYTNTFWRSTGQWLSDSCYHQNFLEKPADWKWMKQGTFLLTHCCHKSSTQWWWLQKHGHWRPRVHMKASPFQYYKTHSTWLHNYQRIILVLFIFEGVKFKKVISIWKSFFICQDFPKSAFIQFAWKKRYSGHEALYDNSINDQSVFVMFQTIMRVKTQTHGWQTVNCLTVACMPQIKIAGRPPGKFASVTTFPGPTCLMVPAML